MGAQVVQLHRLLACALALSPAAVLAEPSHRHQPPKLLDEAARVAGIAPAVFTPFAFGESRSYLPAGFGVACEDRELL